MNKKAFYDRFHKKSTVQFKIIKKSNFTYSPTLNLLDRFIPNTSNFKILDYGCGVGAIDLYYANKGNQILGTDISPDAIEIANKTSKYLKLEDYAKFVDLAKFNCSYKDEEFDLILCNEVLEHLDSDFEILVHLKKMLKKGGILIASVPSLNAPLYKIGLAKGFDKEVGHLRRYKDSIIRNLFTRAGYKIELVVRREGVVRNSLYVIKSLGYLVRFIRGPLVPIISYIDNISMMLWGESDIVIIGSVS